MVDLAALREDVQRVKELIQKKEPGFPVDKLIELDKLVRALRTEVEGLRKEKNDLAFQGARGITPELREKSIQIGKKLKGVEGELDTAQKDLSDVWLACPNVPHPDLPVGDKEANKVIKTHLAKPSFDFTNKNHLELNEKLEWFDIEIAANMSGSQFVFYKEFGAKIIYALTRLMLKNNKKHGFQPVIPPYLVSEKSLYNSSNLPKFAGDCYKIENEDLYLIPTAEANLTNVYAGKIISDQDLPLRMAAWTSCFRREAGTYGATERGLIRIHQFEKVEIYSICQPERSYEELDYMVTCSEEILKQLGLHYQISMLATQDCSFASAKTFDIEVWLPGQNRYYEVSSCSNCTDFQSRRSKIRYRKTKDSKPELVHTLNASSLALPRLMIALMENFQQPDGSVKLPEVLQKEVDDLW